MDAQVNHQKDYLLAQANQQKKQFTMQIEMEVKQQEMALQQLYAEQTMVLFGFSRSVMVRLKSYVSTIENVAQNEPTLLNYTSDSL